MLHSQTFKLRNILIIMHNNARSLLLVRSNGTEKKIVFTLGFYQTCYTFIFSSHTFISFLFRARYYYSRDLLNAMLCMQPIFAREKSILSICQFNVRHFRFTFIWTTMMMTIAMRYYLFCIMIFICQCKNFCRHFVSSYADLTFKTLKALSLSILIA